MDRNTREVSPRSPLRHRQPAALMSDSVGSRTLCSACQPSGKPLGHHAGQGRCDKEGFDPHLMRRIGVAAALLVWRVASTM